VNAHSREARSILRDTLVHVNKEVLESSDLGSLAANTDGFAALAVASLLALKAEHGSCRSQEWYACQFGHGKVFLNQEVREHAINLAANNVGRVILLSR
jgi:hypothetical protein